QAEDGIRDFHVTGVQTCALPILALSKKIFADRSNGKNVYTAEPIKSIHLHSQKSYEPEANGSARSVNFLLVAALFILVVGSINYINLTTDWSSRRMKESGVRKLMGSSRKQLFFQFLEIGRASCREG